MNVYEALGEVQFSLKAPKTQRNSFGGYNFRSAEDILEAVKPLLHEVGAVVNLSDEVLPVGGRFYVVATAIFSTYDGEQVAVQGWAREQDERKGMDASQVTGSASSYARKYALNGLFAIDDEKDADATNTHGKDAPSKAPKPSRTAKEPRGGAKAAQTAQEGAKRFEDTSAFKRAVELGIKPEGMLRWYAVQPFADKTASEWTKAEREQVKAYLLEMIKSAEALNG